MVFNPTLDVHPEGHYHQEFHFADNTDSSGWCCCWKSRSKPREYNVNEQGEFVGVKRLDYRTRVVANARLCSLIKVKLSDDPAQCDKLFERLKLKINDDLSPNQSITSERLSVIINAIYELKQELDKEQSSPTAHHLPKRLKSKKHKG